MPDRDVLNILATPGYVSVITGEPGVGKTTLALMACAMHGRCTYISYADPPQALEAKLRAVSPGFKGSFKAVSALSGSPEAVFSEIADAAGRGELVIVDTADAMLYEVKEGMRSLLQLVYGSVKVKQGSLVLISEGDSQTFSQLKYVADAVISMKFEEVLGQPVRAIRVLKDRDMPVAHPLHYVTLSNRSILEPYPVLTRPRAGKFRKMAVPPELEIKAQMDFGPSILMELGEGVTSMTARLYAELFITRFLKKGFLVNWLTGPAEFEETVRAEVKAMAGRSADGLRIVKADPAKAGYRAERFFELMAKDQGPNVVDFINLMAEEDFAVTAPVEFERFLNMILKDATEKGRLSFVYGYSGLSSVKIERKYVHAIRRLVSLNGFLFWRSIRPLGPLYYVDMRPESGSIEFVEMV